MVPSQVVLKGFWLQRVRSVPQVCDGGPQVPQGDSRTVSVVVSIPAPLATPLTAPTGVQPRAGPGAEAGLGVGAVVAVGAAEVAHGPAPGWATSSSAFGSIGCTDTAGAESMEKVVYVVRAPTVANPPNKGGGGGRGY